MLNIVYLVIFVLSDNGSTTSLSIPQANMNQCQANAKIYNTNKNTSPVYNDYGASIKTTAAHCIVGVMSK